MFLFHTGSIKSNLKGVRAVYQLQFLFHTGSIKSLTDKASVKGLMSFYSILVRLKGKLSHI